MRWRCLRSSHVARVDRSSARLDHGWRAHHGGIVMQSVRGAEVQASGGRAGVSGRRALVLAALALSLSGAAAGQSAVLGSGEFVFDTRWAEEPFAGIAAGYTE